MPKIVTAVLEDYLETLLLLEKDGKTVRLKEIAEVMQVKAPSALEALEVLHAGGLVRHEHYGGFELTAKGRQQAKKVYAKHTSIRDFLIRVLGVDEKIADSDACQIEHCLSSQAVGQIEQFMSFVNNCPKGQPFCLKEFKSGRTRCQCP